MQRKTERKYLVGKSKRHTKEIDMEWVYQQIDKGRTARSVAEELGVGVSTLYKRHKEYQETEQVQQPTELATEQSAEIDDDDIINFLDL